MVRVAAETKAATRERLLEAAACEFGRAGFESASIDAISLAAGFAKGTVYNYFASKDDLFVAVVEEATSRAAHSAPASPSATARERLEVTLTSFCAWARDHDDFARVLVRECLMGSPGRYPRVIAAERPLVGAFEVILSEGATTGELRDDLPPGLLALALAGLTDLALVQHWATGGTKPTIEQLPGLVLRLLLDGRTDGSS